MKDLAGKTTKSTSVEGFDITINAKKGILVDEANVTKADIEASNGAIHMMDRVFMPPTNGKTLS